MALYSARGTLFAVPRRAAGDVRAACGDGDGAPPGRPHTPRPLPGGDGTRDRRRRTASLHRARVPRLPRLRAARAGLRASAVRHVSVRTPRPVLVQGPGDLSKLRRAEGRASGTPIRPPSRAPPPDCPRRASEAFEIGATPRCRRPGDGGSCP